MATTVSQTSLRSTASDPRREEHECAWCGHELPTVPALLDHVLDAHVDEPIAA